MKNKNDRITEIRSFTIGCRYCHAQPKQPCINLITNEPLRHFVAHQKRIDDYRHKLKADQEEVPF